MKVLVTGASGFVGQALCRGFAQAGLGVRAACRRPQAFPAGTELALIDGLEPQSDWSAAVSGVDAVVHLAARVHVMRDDAADPLGECRRINVYGTECLARTAASAGVRRFVFVSSIKAMGERTHPGQAFSEDEPARPVDPYGLSKWEAEQALRAVADDTGIELVIVRPPLVYGPGVRANFLGLMQLAARGLPLPLGDLDNRRSLVYLHNLCDALRHCTVDPRAAGELFLVADDEALSTTELVRALALALGTQPRLLPVPPAALRLAARLTGQSAVMARLSESLVVDTTRIRKHLDWVPPFSVREGFAATAAWFLDQRRSRRR